MSVSAQSGLIGLPRESEEDTEEPFPKESSGSFACPCKALIHGNSVKSTTRKTGYSPLAVVET